MDPDQQDGDRELPGKRHPVRIVLVAGTRPEAIKLAPLLLAARGRDDLVCTMVGTGQHEALFHDALAAFRLVADVMLGPGSPNLTMDALERRIMETLPPLLVRLAADLVVVQGDTTSAWGAARAAHHHGVPLAHVEAGLRSGDPLLPWPEERNRIEIDRLADLLFAPSEAAAANLRDEGVAGHIHVTGNSGIDALLLMRERTPPLAAAAPGVYRILATCHRRENTGPALASICEALRRLAWRYDVRLTIALPGDPAKQQAMIALLRDAPHIKIVRPVGYQETVAMLQGADLVLSDSGGLQEECAALGLPMLVLRDNSERPEVIESGNAILVGSVTDAIVDAAVRVISDPAVYAAMARPSFPYGKGDAAERMLDLIDMFPLPRWRPPQVTEAP